MYLSIPEANKICRESIDFDNKIGNIKLLNQKERDLIVSAIDIILPLEKQPENQMVLWSDETRELLNNIIDKAAETPKSKHSNFLVSFFKGIANRFGRISSATVHNKIKLLTENGRDTPKS